MSVSPDRQCNEHVGNSAGNSLSKNLHAGKCSVCRHTQGEDIERDILAWRSPKEIVKEYKLGNRRAVYRHALPPEKWSS
jgi:hypothetical protein